MKECRTCGERKELGEFYGHAAMKDGHLNNCKSCVLKRVKKHRAVNIEKIRADDRKRGLSPERLRANRERGRLEESLRRQAARQRANSALYAKYKKAWIERNPEKRRAQVMVGNFVRDGKLKRGPCLECDAVKAEAHHDDYCRPLDVRWLCRKCHAKHHRRYA